VEGSIFLEMARQLLTTTGKNGGKAVFFISPKDASDFRGMRNRNIKILYEEFGACEIGIEEDPEQKRESLVLVVNEKRHETSFTKMNYDEG
jgi:hypothetical protein